MLDNGSARVYLASGSPRRRELLDQIGVAHELLSVEVDETQLAGETPGQFVRRLALAKARAGRVVLAGEESSLVVGADTAVVIDDRILGKPRDRADFMNMMELLSGRTHRVLTAVAVIGVGERVCLNRNEVSFRRIPASEAAAYWQTGEPRDKAGGYGIQGLGALFVSHLSGSYSGVMGLPLYETAELLREQGVRLAAKN